MAISSFPETVRCHVSHVHPFQTLTSEVFLLLLKLPNLLFNPSPTRRPVVFLLRTSPSKSEDRIAFPDGLPLEMISALLPLALR